MLSFRYFVMSILFILLKYVESKGELRILDENRWSDMLEGEWMVEFYAPWCPACQQLQPLWEEFAKWSDDLGIKIGSVDVTLNPGLSGRFMITALPTIFHVKDGVFRQYRGARDKESFFSFVEEKKWQSLDPVSSWKSPQSFQMSAIAYFFKLSMLLRSLHSTIVEEYGVPYWGSYILFGLATILIGTLLGLIIVCVLDFFCHSRSPGYESMSKHQDSDSKKKEQGDREEYEGEDVIKDDSLNDGDLRKRREMKAGD